jgi:hypothetical protein
MSYFFEQKHSFYLFENIKNNYKNNFCKFELNKGNIKTYYPCNVILNIVKNLFYYTQ